MKITESFAKYQVLLPIHETITENEAEYRASMFLEAIDSVVNLRHLLTNEHIKMTSIHSAVYAQQLDRAQAKTITESKVIAEASESYVKSREDMERIENDISYLKCMYEVFLNAHVFYRQICNQE